MGLFDIFKNKSEKEKQKKNNISDFFHKIGRAHV